MISDQQDLIHFAVTRVQEESGEVIDITQSVAKVGLEEVQRREAELDEREKRLREMEVHLQQERERLIVRCMVARDGAALFAKSS